MANRDKVNVGLSEDQVKIILVNLRLAQDTAKKSLIEAESIVAEKQEYVTALNKELEELEGMIDFLETASKDPV